MKRIMWLLPILLIGCGVGKEYKPIPELTIVSFRGTETAGLVGVKSYTEQLRDSLDCKGKYPVVVNGGMVGDTSRSAIERFKKDLLEGVKPAMVIIQFGGQDSQKGLSAREYRDNILLFVRVLKLMCIKVLLMTPNPIEGGSILLDEYAEIVREIALSEQVYLVDVQKRFNKEAQESSLQKVVKGDQPTEKGNSLTAERLIDIVKQIEPCCL